LKPFQESLPNRYCRLFPPAQLPIKPERYCEALQALGAAMIDQGGRVSDERPEILVETGYTYFGQLVAHDLTKDVSSIEEAWWKDPSDLENLQTPRLDLSVLYGGGPSTSPELYEDDKVRLRTGKSFDVCVGRQGERILADDRGAENLILRQMTAVFCRLHNFAVEQLRPQFSSEASLFEHAQRRTGWQFQYLAVRDYLATILDRNVYNKVFLKGRPQIRWKTFSVPIEFSAAAMRFGHAMVRPNYLFSYGHEMRLPEVFGRTPERGSLNDELKINWGLFFQGAGSASALTARPIDTRLAEPFQNLPPDLIGAAEARCPFASPSEAPSQLAVRTLLRGSALKLPSGQVVARAFNEEMLSESEITQNSTGSETKQGRIILAAGLAKETPLWYYILKESEVRHNGNCLGPVGSHLVAETIFAALRSDPSSYVNRSPRDEFPPLWKFSGEERRIHGLSELFRLASIF
jgi:heme peroxidase